MYGSVIIFYRLTQIRSDHNWSVITSDVPGVIVVRVTLEARWGPVETLLNYQKIYLD